MPGFSTAPDGESVLFADNASFDDTPLGGIMTTDGDLWIGATASPHVRKGTLTSTDGSVTITPGAGTIDLSALGSSLTLTPNIGLPVSASGGTITLQGAGNLYTYNPAFPAGWMFILDKAYAYGTLTTLDDVATPFIALDFVGLPTQTAPIDGTYTLNIQLSAYDVTNGKSASWLFQACINYISGTTTATLIGSDLLGTGSPYIQLGCGAVSATLSCVGSSLNITCTGTAATTINWSSQTLLSFVS